MAADDTEKRRRECWETITRGAGQITAGLMQIVSALAKYYGGEFLTNR